MWRIAARVQRNVPSSVTPRTACHCSSVMSTRSTVPPSPALFTMYVDPAVRGHRGVE